MDFPKGYEGVPDYESVPGIAESGDTGAEAFSSVSGEPVGGDTSYMTVSSDSAVHAVPSEGPKRVAAAAEGPREKPITSRLPAETGPPDDTPAEVSNEVEEATVHTRPALHPGETYHYKDGEWHEGTDDSHYNPEEPGTAYAEAGTLVTGRAAEGEDIVFSGASGDGRVVTLYNLDNQEGALLHVDAADAVTDEGEHMIDDVIGVVPALADPSVIARIFGDVEESDIPGRADEWNNRLAGRLRRHGIAEVQVITRGYGKQVRLTLADGRVQAFDAHGEPLHDETPGQN